MRELKNLNFFNFYIQINNSNVIVVKKPNERRIHEINEIATDKLHIYSKF